MALAPSTGGVTAIPSLEELDLEAAVFELNSLPLRSCQLLASLHALRDGKIFSELLLAAAQSSTERAVASHLLSEHVSAAARLHGILLVLPPLLVGRPRLAEQLDNHYDAVSALSLIHI